MLPSERVSVQGLRLQLEDLAESFREVTTSVGARDKAITKAHGHLLSPIRELEAV